MTLPKCRGLSSKCWTERLTVIEADLQAAIYAPRSSSADADVAALRAYRQWLLSKKANAERRQARFGCRRRADVGAPFC
jgi:hypothetical protein